ncbi:MAG: hypothetical protein IJ735_05785 [Clostridia bacterium]|nr:hypothetical protein [Clostridia bacterium]
MIYSFKKGVAGDFTFSENLVPPHAYFTSFSSRAAFRERPGQSRRDLSDRRRSLSGEWDFAVLPDGLTGETFDSSLCVDKIAVPSSLIDLGFCPPIGVSLKGEGPDLSHPKKKIPDGKKSENFLFIYKKSFFVNDLSMKYTVVFTDVGGRFDVYLNGVYCGFSALGEGEFSLPYLVEGENELLVVIKRWSPRLFIARGSARRDLGVLGDVYLTWRGQNALFDYNLYCTEDNGVYNGKFTFVFSSDNTGARAEINLSRNGVEEFSIRSDVTSSPVEYEFSRPFLPYSSDDPALYDLCVRIIEKGKVTEYVRTEVGFCALGEQSGTITLSSLPLKIRAAEYNAVRNGFGEAMTFSDYVRDFALLKKYGFNAIKTVFPLDPSVLEAACRAGLYLILSVGLNTDGENVFGTKHRDLVSDDKRFSKAYLEKTAYLYARTGNNPAVLFYDFGQESATAFNVSRALSYVADKGQKLVLARDYADIVSLDAPTVDGLIDEINRVSAQKPVFLRSYALSSGLGSGYLTDFDEIIDNTPCCLGGCVTRFVDDGPDGLCLRDEGLFSGDRKAYPAAELHRYLARPIKVRVAAEDKIEIINTSYRTDVKDKTLLFTILCDGKVEQKYRMNVAIPPRTAREIDLLFGQDTGDKHLTVTCYDRGGEVSCEQLVLHTASPFFDVRTGQKLKVWEKGDFLEIAFESGRATFSRSTGALVRYSLLGVEVLSAAPGKKTGGCAGIKIDRPFVRNILSGDYARTDFVPDKFSYTTSDNKAEISIDTRLFVDGKQCFTVADKYLVYASGAIEVTSVLRPNKKCPPNIDCFAKAFRFNGSFDRVTYYGRGAGDNYVDLNAHAIYGVYETTAAKMSSGTDIGQERGNRTDVHYTVLRNAEGLGLLLSADRAPYQLRVSTSSDEELAKAYLIGSEAKMSGVYVDVAALVSGYGGGFGEPLPKYLVKSAEHTLTFTMIPLKTQAE